MIAIRSDFRAGATCRPLSRQFGGDPTEWMLVWQVTGGLVPAGLRGTNSGDKLIHISDWCKS